MKKEKRWLDMRRALSNNVAGKKVKKKRKREKGDF